MNHDKRRRSFEREPIIIALSELIEALDRRIPQVERLGELRIAREAAILRIDAQVRIDALTTAESNRQSRDDELSDTVMADDGSSVPVPVR